jgi:hypothetical protein
VVSFVALYRGESLQDAALVAVSTDPALVTHVAAALLAAQESLRDGDPVTRAVQAGRRKALRLLKAETAGPNAGHRRTRAPGGMTGDRGGAA